MTEPTLPEGASLGAALRLAREAAGLTVEQVSADTRIRGTLIRDLESDRFESSGAPVYARGHVRAIAHAVRVDPAPYVALFAQQVGGTDEPFPVPTRPPVIPASRGPLAPPEPLHVPTAARPERRGPNWMAAASAAVGVLVVLFAIGQLTRPAAPVSSDGPLAAGGPSSAASPAAPRPKATPAAVRVVANGAELRLLLVGGDSWVSVRAGTGTLFEGVLRDGASKDFKDAQQLRLVVGNAAAVSISCGGREPRPAGGQGMVLRFTCTAQGLAPA